MYVEPSVRPRGELPPQQPNPSPIISSVLWALFLFCLLVIVVWTGKQNASGPASSETLATPLY